MRSTDILELVSGSATLLVVAASCKYAWLSHLSASVIAVNKEGAKPNMAIQSAVQEWWVCFVISICITFVFHPQPRLTFLRR